MTRRHLLLLLALLSVAAGVAGGAWVLFLRPIGVHIVKAERDVPVLVFGLGTVEARVASKIGFKVSGVLIDLQADHGDRVAKGTVLARLDIREQAARVGRAKASVDQAEANLKRAAANVAKAEVAYANAKSISDRRQALVQMNSVSIETAETAKATLDIARADLNVTQSDVEVARAAARDTRAQEELERVTLDLHALAAPYDAVVIARQKELGTVLAPGEPVFTVVDPRTIWVLAYIDESKAGEIQVGQRAEIVLRSLPGRRFQGHVIRIEIESDRVNEERRIEVTFDRLAQDFHLGEQAEVHVTTAELAEALLIPETAVEDFKSGRGAVWTVEDGLLERREAAFGHRMLDGRLEITDGIPDGARVLARLSGGLRIGRAARIVEDGGR
jgi:HlyD family secretion protein